MINCKICTQEFAPPREKGLSESKYVYCNECHDCGRIEIHETFKEILNVLKEIE